MRIPKMKNIQVIKTRKHQKVNQKTVENQRGLRDYKLMFIENCDKLETLIIIHSLVDINMM